MEEPQVDSYGRMKGVTMVKPVVYGSSARYFPKKREEDGHTHYWNIYFRPYYNEDTSKWIRKVTFKLHDSYANSTRTCEQYPYQITETGWGEFEIIIKVYFVDPNEKPDPQCIAGKKAVVSEYYDEIVFQEPSKFLYKHLLATDKTQRSILKLNHPDTEDKKKLQLDMIVGAREEVRSEISDLKNCLKEARTLLTSWRDMYKKEADTAPTPTPQDPNT